MTSFVTIISLFALFLIICPEKNSSQIYLTSKQLVGHLKAYQPKM